MRRFFFLLLSGYLAVALTACGPRPKPSPPPTAAPPGPAAYTEDSPTAIKYGAPARRVGFGAGGGQQWRNKSGVTTTGQTFSGGSFAALDLRGCHNCIFDGCTFTKSHLHGCYTDNNCSGLVFRRCHFIDNGNCGLLACTVSDVTAEDCDATNNGFTPIKGNLYGHGFYAGDGCRKFTGRRLKSTRNAALGFQANSETGRQMEVLLEDVETADNARKSNPSAGIQLACVKGTLRRVKCREPHRGLVVTSFAGPKSDVTAQGCTFTAPTPTTVTPGNKLRLLAGAHH